MSDDARVVRARIEVVGPSEALVDELLRLTMAIVVPKEIGWEIEDHQIIGRTNLVRHWGRMTMRKAESV